MNLADRFPDQPPTAGLVNLVGTVRAMEPSGIEATDTGGAVRVRLGPDGLPGSFEIDQDWRSRLHRGSFAQAVLEACQAATERRLTDWTRRLEDPDWPEQAGRVVETTGSDVRDVDAATRAPERDVVAREPGDPRPRARRVVIDEILQAVDNIDGLLDSPGQPSQGVGSAAFGKLVLTVSEDELVSCTADEGWVSQRTAEELTHALEAALASARADLTSAVRASPTGRLAALMDELATGADARSYD